MNKILFAGLLLGLVAGCNHNKKDCKDGSKCSSTQMSAKDSAEKDDCPMCPGVQTAKADGTCPKCGMKVKG